MSGATRPPEDDVREYRREHLMGQASAAWVIPNDPTLPMDDAASVIHCVKTA